MPLHPFVEAMLKATAGRPAFSDGSPGDARALVAAGRAALGSGPELYKVEDITIPTRGGSLPARLLMPSAQPRGLVVYFHGGGWVVASIDDFETLGRTLAAASDCAVLLPDYRLAPEHPFPAALEDSEDVLLWAGKARASLCGSGPLVVAGDSAGGNLATVAAASLRGRTDLALQVLIYPVTDCDFTRHSYSQHGAGLPLTARDMQWFFGHYAPQDAWQHPQVSPMRLPDPSGLPPALIVTAEYDVLADEGRAYARRLGQFDVRVEHREAAGMTHGFIRWHNLVDVAREELNAIAVRIAAACDAATQSR
jgi:acetyl esterase